MRKESISFSNGRCNRLHDIREIVSQNIDSRLTKFNRNLIDIPVERAYEDIFGKCLEEYNKGKKPSRQIKNYLEHLREQEREGREEKKRNVRHPEYEYVGQIGNRESGLGLIWDEVNQQVRGNKANFDKLNSIFEEYLRVFKERYPNLYITGFQIHWDEPNGTPHFHLRFIPVATGYKKGMEKQCGLTKALEQCGFKKTDRRHEMAISDFRHEQMDLLEEIALKHDIERVDMNNKCRHIPNGLYQQMMKEKDQILAKISAEKDKEKELLKKIIDKQIEAHTELKEVQANIKDLQLQESLLRQKYEDMLSQPPKEVIKEVEKNIDYKELYEQFDSDVRAFVDMIDKLPPEVQEIALKNLPKEQTEQYFNYHSYEHNR